ncbi:hypothetical protein Vlu01_28080 [Micromonospora lutea]|uniref:Uncharacterized protein n=1 Tax=Micromonospora lutea TaxID=419825 RepID=A0ABQ4IW79_9ACTN|nr:hypothetical protein Vlu01_28080 [Micromonospora lutea]
MLVQLGGESGGQPGVYLEEETDGRDSRVVEGVRFHRYIVPVLDSRNIVSDIVAAADVVLLNNIFLEGSFS